MRSARFLSPSAHVVLTAHGSRDPRAATTVRAITRAVAAARPDVTVHDAYLDFDAPHLGTVLAATLGAPTIVVPLLLSAAYHAGTDIPAIVDAARDRGGRVEVADVLPDVRDGGLDLTVAALRRRLREARTGASVDALVLAAAGTRNPTALAGIEDVADAVAGAEGLRCITGYASGAGRPMHDAMDRLRAGGARSIGVVSYFLAPGRLFDRITRVAGGAIVAQPLGDAEEIVAIATRRIDHCLIASQALV
jgi:sirohydrochlorin ferrochelatase